MYQQVNKAFWKICQEDMLWKNHLIEEFPSSIKIITKDYKRVLLQANYIQKLNKIKKKEVNVMLLGRSAVGKTPLIVRYLNGIYIDEYVTFYFIYNQDPTILDTYRKQVKHKDDVYLYNIIDASGLDEYFEIVKPDMYKTEVFILCYDVTSKKTWRKVVKYFDFLKDTIKLQDYRVILACLKYDLINEGCELDWEEIKTFQKNNNLKNFMVSSKTNLNVEELFNQVIMISLSDEEWKDLEDNKFEKYYKKEGKKKCSIM